MNGDKSKPSDILYTTEELTKQRRITDLENALLDVNDLMHRVLLQDNFLLLGMIAKCVYEDKFLEGDGIDCGIEKKYLTPEVINTLRTWTKAQITDKGLVYEIFEGVPVRIKFINRRYPWFSHPITKIYGVEEYQIPNPFEKYWKARFLIK